MATDDSPAPEYAGLPFQEAIDFFRQKVNVPSARWADIRDGAHARAFTVAGATKEGMLTDFRTAIDRAIVGGTTLEQFGHDFDDIVQKYGWDHNGTRGFRTRTIWEANLTTAYSAGRYAQMTDPDVVRVRPYWRYRHSDNVAHPRPEHLAWDGLVLRHDNPWISTHYTPNGWGCHCSWESLSERELKALGKNGPDQAPPEEMRTATLNTSAGPVEIQVPKGVDPGWGYSVGEAAQGKRLSDQQMDAWRQQGADAWESLTPNDQPPTPKLPLDPPVASPGRPTATVDALHQAIRSAIGAEEKAVPLPTGDTVLIDAGALADHWKDHLERGQLAPLLLDVLQDPAEVWLSFERHKGTGQVVLRQRLLKLIQMKGKPGLLALVQASKGRLDLWTFFETNAAYLQKQRRGRLIWARKP